MMEQKSNLEVSEQLLKDQACLVCNYVEGCAAGTLYCVPAGQIIPRPIPGWCPLKSALAIKMMEKAGSPIDLKWIDSVEDGRLRTAYMSAGFSVPGDFSMVVQQPNQRPGAPYREGHWMLSSNVMGLLRHKLKATTAEEAKKEAIQIAREKLREAMLAIRDVIVEIEQHFTDDPDVFGMYDGALLMV